MAQCSRCNPSNAKLQCRLADSGDKRRHCRLADPQRRYVGPLSTTALRPGSTDASNTDLPAAPPTHVQESSRILTLPSFQDQGRDKGPPRGKEEEQKKNTQRASERSNCTFLGAYGGSLSSF
eukprot:6189171-Amphidinium_carterae.1